jgi:Transposase IS116/IS110/IS902 family
MTRLEQLRTTQGGALPPRLKSEIKRELQRLELVVEMIATLEAERNAIVEDEASTHVNAKKIQNLHKLKAIGPEFAAVLVGEIFHRDFNNRRQLASYVGFAPSPFRAETWRMTKGSARPATARGEPPGSNSPGCGCAIARQRFERLVPGACRHHERPHPPHRRRGIGTQAAGGVMALS